MKVKDFLEKPLKEALNKADDFDETFYNALVLLGTGIMSSNKDTKGEIIYEAWSGLNEEDRKAIISKLGSPEAVVYFIYFLLAMFDLYIEMVEKTIETNEKIFKQVEKESEKGGLN